MHGESGKSANGEANVFQKDDGRWFACFQFHLGEIGEQVTVFSPVFETRKESVSWLRDFAALVSDRIAGIGEEE